MSLIVYAAPDLDKAKQFFSVLTGAEPYADSPYYVEYRSGDMEVGIDPNGDQSLLGALAYWNVSDIAASVKALVDAGGAVVKEPTDVGYGLLVASVKSPSGSIVGLRQPPKG